MKSQYSFNNKIQYKLALYFAFFNSFISFSQTNISGIVNNYYSVIEVVPAKACIRVSNIGGLTVNKRVMLVQMKGVSISTSNNSSFGDTTSTNNAGFYEIGTVCYIRGDSVFLFHNLINTYTPLTGKVQLVQFGEYSSANVIDTIKAAPWNNTTGTGGVIALFADQDITLNAPIYADSSGFRGGQIVVSNGTCFNGLSAYYYPAASATPQNGAYKGEGAVDIVSTQNGGRGALANGGGGGNNHNNSGGGGANLNAGGIGGGNSSTTGCTTTLRGIGGKPFKNWNGQKIFLGGGGGAGHNNNGIFTLGGGNGGGIIFIWTPNLIGNNKLISADGGDGGESQSDGAGGGGAGGTIIMNVANYFGNVTIQANGGNGGNSNDAGNTNRCFGGGGGGSGGAIYFEGPTPSITNTVTGGLAGVESGRDAGCAAEQAALAGSNGQIFPGYTFTRSTTNANYCALLLPSKLISFKGVLQNKEIMLSWQLQNPELVKLFVVEKSNDNRNWIVLTTINAEDNRENYTAIDNSILPGDNFYRLTIREKSTAVYYSEIRRIFYDVDDTEFLLYPNPAYNKINIYRKTDGTATIKIADITGKTILQKIIWNRLEEILLPVLPSGIYLLTINQSVKKLVIR